jgi:hypothetical protein
LGNQAGLGGPPNGISRYTYYDYKEKEPDEAAFPWLARGLAGRIRDLPATLSSMGLCGCGCRIGHHSIRIFVKLQEK